MKDAPASRAEPITTNRVACLNLRNDRVDVFLVQSPSQSLDGYGSAGLLLRGETQATMERKRYSWRIHLNNEVVDTLYQRQDGAFYCGDESFPGMSIQEAALELIFRRGLRPRCDVSGVLAEPEDGP